MPLFAERRIEYTGNETRVCIGQGLLADCGPRCLAVARSSRALVVTDDHLVDLYATPVAESLNSAGVPTGLHVVPSGDASKSLGETEQIYDRLADLGVGRDGLVVAVGGGMITDLAGFAAGTWMRGVSTVLCPTTLEADIDASVGGKTGVNHPKGKNLIGVFHQPRLVLIDVDCLKSLPQRDVRAGMAESIKHAIITGEPFVSWHEAHAGGVLAGDEATLASLIEQNVATKADIVSRDERETAGLRAVLNFGHTVGHAIEAAAVYRLRHGECVSLGMVAACRLSRGMGMLDGNTEARIVRLLEMYGLPGRLGESLDTEGILDLMALDKKAAGGKTRFVLLEGIGLPVVTSDVDEDAVRDAVASLS